MSTLHDVARKAGVTAATVSNVIRNKGAVGEATRARVLAAIQEVGYHPNLMARGLVEQRSFTLALMLEDISNPFYPEVALEIERAAREKGYHLLLCNSLGEPSLAKGYLEKLMGGWVDGLVTVVGGLSPDDALAAKQHGLPVVLCNWSEHTQQIPLPRVEMDLRRAGYLAGQHLIDLGHLRIAAIIEGAAKGQPVAHALRLEGFQNALQEAKLSLPSNYLKLGHSTIESGYIAAKELFALKEPPTALFASNDLMAIGALEAAKDSGLRVPEQLSIIGFDDIKLSGHVRPALTTINLSKRQLAEVALELLLAQIENVEMSQPYRLVEPRLIIRNSTAPIQRSLRQVHKVSRKTSTS